MTLINKKGFWLKISYIIFLFFHWRMSRLILSAENSPKAIVSYDIPAPMLSRYGVVRSIVLPLTLKSIYTKNVYFGFSRPLGSLKGASL